MYDNATTTEVDAAERERRRKLLQRRPVTESPLNARETDMYAKWNQPVNRFAMARPSTPQPNYFADKLQGEGIAAGMTAPLPKFQSITIPTEQEMTAARNEPTPPSPALAGVGIQRRMGSQFQNQEADAITGRMNTLNGTGNAAVRGGMNPYQARVMGLNPQPGNFTQPNLARGGAPIRNVGDGGLPVFRDANGGLFNERGAGRVFVGNSNRGEMPQDFMRRRQDINRFNMARASENTNILADKRIQRHGMGAANRMFRAAITDRDPRVRAEGINAAAAMGLNLTNRPRLQRTGFEDFRREDFMERQAGFNRDFLLRKAELENPPRQFAPVDPNLTDSRKAQAERDRAEVDALKGKLDDRTKAQVDRVQSKLDSLYKSQAIYANDPVKSKATADEIAALEKQMDSLLGGGNNTASASAPADYSTRPLPAGHKLQRSKSTGEQFVVKPNGSVVPASEFFTR